MPGDGSIANSRTVVRVGVSLVDIHHGNSTNQHRKMLVWRSESRGTK